MTPLAATVHQPRLLGQAFSPLTDRLRALLRHDRKATTCSMRNRVAASVVGAIVPVALYVAFIIPELLATAHACVGSPPV